jgi:hypothetical protein
MHHPFRLRPLLMLLALTTLAQLVAQDGGMAIYGTVRDMDTRDSIPFPQVLVEEVGSEVPPITAATNARGRYEITLNEQKVYLIRYSAPGKVAKSVQVDLRGPSAEDWAGGYGMHVDITLLDELPGVDLSVLAQPFGKAHYAPASGNFEWDLEYTRALKDRQAALLKAYNERKK